MEKLIRTSGLHNNYSSFSHNTHSNNKNSCNFAIVVQKQLRIIALRLAIKLFAQKKEAN